MLRLGARTRLDARADLREEFEHHLRLRITELMRAGMSEEAAGAQALIAFGDVDAALNRCLEEDVMKIESERRTRWLDELRQDLRFGTRQLLRDRGFAAIAIATLALGIGLNTAVFTVVDALFLRGLPFPDADRLVAVQLISGEGASFQGANARGLEHVRERSGNAIDLAAWSGWSFNLRGRGPSEELSGAVVTPRFFDILGVAPLHGRWFNTDDAIPGQRTVILSHGLWQRRFGGDPTIVGQSILLDTAALPVVGIMPRDFAFPSREAELWLPMIYANGQAPNGFGTTWIGRLVPGVTLEQAQAQLRTAAAGARTDHPELGRDFAPDLALLPVRDALIGQFRRPAAILFGAVTFVLLIACANVANLLLTRATGRSTELAVRASLGAGRGRIVRQLLTEQFVLAFLATTLGIALAVSCLRLLHGWLPEDATNFAAMRVDWRVLAYALVTCVLTLLLCGAGPAFSLRMERSFEALKGSARTLSASGARRAGLRAVIALEIALAVVLGVGALLMLQSFWRLRHEDTGFNAQGVLAIKFWAPQPKYRGDTRLALMNDVMQRVTAVPGVRSAGAIQILPLGGSNWNPRMEIESRPVATRDDLPEVDWRSVTHDYFRTMSVPLITGRMFQPTDDPRAPAVAVVNETLSRRLFPNGDVIGQRVSTAFEGPGNWVTVVGVVGDTKDQTMAGEANAQIYRPWQQYAINPVALLVRTDGRPMDHARAVQDAILAIDRDITLADVRSMNEVIGSSVAQPRLLTALLTGFGLLAVTLGAIGIYGVIAYGVEQRKREFGIRAALGATRRNLVTMILQEGARTAGIGAALGITAALLLSRVLETQLYEVQPLDVRSYAVVAIGVMLIALFATMLPARRIAPFLRRPAPAPWAGSPHPSKSAVRLCTRRAT